ncbi:gag/polymerase/env polyprotein, putative [Talaromyces stipitatus ATCC 10500]|uniref:Gag/polymerase/env polyprotein, putative n=1 Tax=Talaromyces stipitatus (strain ATCC 10500 / CBS 375.48 / QM 6759 / NRRL 1006) TaxID=441959 RepID=B8LU87_TALSN|nr:gag/polymerase/env polyprotein, putative [Talaromyces stipitatus ATCC 10500]EED22559.1 gag/polymerase/env polyprotein, putative [Talaromyces stipitatus ATCC 10500]
MIRGNGFHRLVHLYEIDKIVEDKKTLEEKLEEEEIRKKLLAYLKDFVDVFSKHESDKLPPHQPYNHKIELEKPNELSYNPLYKMSRDELEAAQEYIIDNLNKGFLEPSSSPFAAPIIMASKPGGGLRFCVDYRKLNQLTKKDQYPLPLIDEVFERLSRARIFTKLDIRQGFHRIRMDPDSEEYTTFWCRYDTYKYKVMPFGLTNSPATFQRFVNNIFMDYLDRFLIAFVDDLLIYSENMVEHQIHVKMVLERLRATRLQAAIHKCKFSVERTKFLGFIVTKDGIEVNQEKIKAITEWKAPTTIFGIWSFLGFYGFYQKFIRGYSRIAKLLNYLTRQDVPFKWTIKCQEAFNKLKRCLASAPVLCHYQPELPSQLETNASDGVVAAVFSQLQEDGHWHLVAYFSKTMTDAEFNYDIYDKELLAIVSALKEWRAELHRPGKENTLADALTWRESTPVDRKKGCMQLMLPKKCLGPSPGSVELSPMDTAIDVISRVITANTRSPEYKQFRELARTGDENWTLHENVLLFKDQVFIPDEGDLRAWLLDEIHSRYYWITWNKDVERYVDNYITYKHTNTRRDLPPGLLNPLPIPSRPWQHISMDFMTYPPDKIGCDTVFVVVDWFGKTPISIPCSKNVDARELARLWIKYVYARTGLLDSIVSDRGPQFMLEFWNEISLSIADHAQTDGQTEIANQYLSQRLRPYVNHFQDDWSEWLPIINFAAASLPQDSTGLSPFIIEKGFQPRMSFDWRKPDPPRKFTANEKNARVWVKQFQEIWDFARADKHRQEVDFDVGDKVIVSTKGWRIDRPSRKLADQAAGPYKIIEKVGQAYRLKLDEEMQIHDVFASEKLWRVSSTEPLRGQILERAKLVEINDQQEWYLAENFKNTPRQLKSFHDRYPEKPGPPVNLQRWIKAAERDKFVDDDRNDNTIEELEPSAWGQASYRGGSNVTILLDMPALEDMRILVDYEHYEWHYKLSKENIQVVSTKRFLKQLVGSVRATNHGS